MPGMMRDGMLKELIDCGPGPGSTDDWIDLSRKLRRMDTVLGKIPTQMVRPKRRPLPEDGNIGPHHPVNAKVLVVGVCVYEQSIQAVLRAMGWWQMSAKGERYTASRDRLAASDLLSSGLRGLAEFVPDGL